MRWSPLLILLASGLPACAAEEEPVANRFARQEAEIENKARALEAQVENEVRATEARLDNETSARCSNRLSYSHHVNLLPAKRETAS
jgi:hypothetical protein